MNCPSCQSPDTQSIKMVLLSGSASSKGRAVGVDSHGDIAVAGMSSQSKTNLVASLEPGPKPDNGGAILGMGCGVIIGISGLPCFAFGIEGVVSGIVFLAIGLAIVGGIAAAAGDRRENLARRLAAWEAKVRMAESGWMCHRCGEKWISE